MNEWLLIGLMALVTFLPRYLPLAFAGKLRVPPLLDTALGFVPMAVLSAIVAQAAFVRGGNYDFSLANIHALAAVAAFVVALLTRHLFYTIGAGLCVFVLLRLMTTA